MDGGIPQLAKGSSERTLYTKCIVEKATEREPYDRAYGDAGEHQDLSVWGGLGGILQTVWCSCELQLV